MIADYITFLPQTPLTHFPKNLCGKQNQTNERVLYCSVKHNYNIGLGGKLDQINERVLPL